MATHQEKEKKKSKPNAFAIHTVTFDPYLRGGEGGSFLAPVNRVSSSAVGTAGRQTGPQPCHPPPPPHSSPCAQGSNQAPNCGDLLLPTIPFSFLTFFFSFKEWFLAHTKPSPTPLPSAVCRHLYLSLSYFYFL